MGVEEANKRIYATTDRAKGEEANKRIYAQGWPTFVVPDDVGGRYSVLSALGLLPIAASGYHHRRADEGRSRCHGALLRAEPGQRRLQVCRHPQHPVPQGQGC